MHQPGSPSVQVAAYARTYPGRAEQITYVRAQLRELLDGCRIADDIILCASELVTNAVLHSNSGSTGGVFTVRAVLRPGDHVHIEVEDNGGSWSAKPRDTSRGHGLDIIRVLASNWGIVGDQSSRTIWARFDWTVRD